MLIEFSGELLHYIERRASIETLERDAYQRFRSENDATPPAAAHGGTIGHA